MLTEHCYLQLCSLLIIYRTIYPSSTMAVFLRSGITFLPDCFIMLLVIFQAYHQPNSIQIFHAVQIQSKRR